MKKNITNICFPILSYDQVKAQDYPNLLVTSGLHDSQAQYFEPTKWVARLRAKKTDKKNCSYTLIQKPDTVVPQDVLTHLKNWQENLHL